MPNLSFEYRGDLKFYLKSKNGTKQIGESHNNGYDALFKLFAKLLAGVDIENKELPAAIDIRYKIGSEYISCLVNDIDINKKYGYIDDNYMTFVEAVVPYSSIVDGVLAEKRVSVLMGDKVEPRKEWINENVDFTLEDNFRIES